MPGSPILLADPQPASRAAYRLILDLAGYSVIEAETGPETIRLATRERPAVILMEITLPLLDGLCALRRLKSAGATAAIPVVMLTLSSDPAHREEADRSGCDGFLPKPCSPQTLLSEISHHLRRIAATAAPRAPRPMPGECVGLDFLSRSDAPDGRVLEARTA
jgi:two-component system, cell cycle response regulator DivK